MPARRGHQAAAAVALAGASLLLCACGPKSATAAATSSATATAGAAGRSASPKAAAPSQAAAVNGTAAKGLTISNGTRFVVENGAVVDFGTAVRDLAWSHDGSKAVFVDGDGDLVTSNPDGSGRVVLARNPGGQTWSHPTWQYRAKDPREGYPVDLNAVIFAVRPNGGTSRLYAVDARAVNGTPKPIALAHGSGENVKDLPQTGNSWPSAGGSHGSAVYANTGDGDVYIRDDYLRQQGWAMAPGSQPAVPAAPAQGSPADGEVVFVRSVGGHDHLFVERGTSATDLTPDAVTDYTEPAVSPDGLTVAARTPQGVVTLPVDGSHAPVKVSDHVGLPSYRP